jgi:myo-inositol-1(or 4)-monophosphatase
VRRRLAGSAIISADRGQWDYRKTGSAAVECILVAIGALEVARFAAPNIWDVAGGVALIRAAGGSVFSLRDGDWLPMTAFEAVPSGEEGVDDLARWRHAMIVGAAESVEAMHLLERS